MAEDYKEHTHYLHRKEGGLHSECEHEKQGTDVVCESCYRTPQEWMKVGRVKGETMFLIYSTQVLIFAQLDFNLPVQLISFSSPVKM